MPKVSVRPRIVTCETFTGQTLYGTTTIEAERADAVLQNGLFRFGVITERDGDYLLTQGSDTWRVPPGAELVAFNLIPEYRAMLEQQFHHLTNA
jgi:hypothetical protein